MTSQGSARERQARGETCPRGKPWTAADLAELRRCWATPGYTVQHIADWLGRSHASVAVIACELGLGRRPPVEPAVVAPQPANRPPLPIGACLDVTMRGPEWASAPRVPPAATSVAIPGAAAPGTFGNSAGGMPAEGSAVWAEP